MLKKNEGKTVQKFSTKNSFEENLARLNDLLIKEKPQKSDAIAWLQGDRFDRGPKTLELFKQGWAPKIIISGNNELVGLERRPGEDNISLGEMKDWLTERGVAEKDIIVDSSSLNTREQSINVSKMAKREKWQQIIIVGSLPHYQARYFLTFLKGAQETGWKGKIISQAVVIADNEKPGGRNKSAKEILLDEIEKIKKYQSYGHLVSVEEGARYLSDDD